MKLLLSIKCEYSKKIFSGEKKFEFRKHKPKRVIDKVFIYECSPSKNIVGWFTVKWIHSGSPEEIWKKCKNSSGIKKNDYFAYCNGTEIIYAIEINETLKFSDPIDPYNIVSNFKPPQSFKYLDGTAISETLKNLFE